MAQRPCIHIYIYTYICTSMGKGVVRLRSQPPHKCSCCGKVGHNIRQCKAPGAQELIHLRASMRSLMKQQPMKRFKNRVRVKVVNNKSGKGKHQASKEYGTHKNQKAGTRQFAHKHVSDSVVDILDTDSGKAYKELMDFGFIHVPDVCPDCKTPVIGPVPFSSCPGKLYFRCQSNQCGRRYNVTDFLVFRGIRLSLVALCRVITFYSRCNVLKAPLVSDAQAQLKISRKPVEHVFNALLAEEAKAGERHNKVKHRLSATNTLVQRLRTRPHDFAKQIQIRSCHLTGEQQRCDYPLFVLVVDLCLRREGNLELKGGLHELRSLLILDDSKQEARPVLNDRHPHFGLRL